MSAASAFPEPPSLIANTRLVDAGCAWASAVAQIAKAGANASCSSRRARLRLRAKLILSPFVGGKPSRTLVRFALVRLQQLQEALSPYWRDERKFHKQFVTPDSRTG